MADDLAVVVPLEVAVNPFEALAVGLQVGRPLALCVLVGQVAQRPVGHVGHLEGPAVDLEGVALLGVLVAAMHLCHLLRGGHLLDVLVGQDLARVDLSHVDAGGASGKNAQTASAARDRRAAAPPAGQTRSPPASGREPAQTAERTGFSVPGGYDDPMSQPFEDLPTTPTSEELLDKAFSRAARTGRAKDGLDAETSMLQTAANIVSDNLENVVTAWPDFDTLDPFYYELADAVMTSNTEGEGGIDVTRQHLSEVGWAGRKVEEIRDEYQGRLRGDVTTARKLRKQAFARIADVVEEVEDDLAAVGAARNDLRDLPDIRPDEPAIVVAGYPNVGKSSFVNAVTNADNETASYPFTTTEIRVGHIERDHIRYQLVDTPGLLDRPPEDRNDIESQAASALEHLADCVLVLVDASGECGYPLEVQLALRDALEGEFDVPVLTVCNKADRSRDVEADHYMSVTEGENVDGVLDAAVAAVGYEPDLPFDE